MTVQFLPRKKDNILKPVSGKLTAVPFCKWHKKSTCYQLNEKPGGFV